MMMMMMCVEMCAVRMIEDGGILGRGGVVNPRRFRNEAAGRGSRWRRGGRGKRGRRRVRAGGGRERGIYHDWLHRGRIVDVVEVTHGGVADVRGRQVAFGFEVHLIAVDGARANSGDSHVHFHLHVG